MLTKNDMLFVPNPLPFRPLRIKSPCQRAPPRFRATLKSPQEPVKPRFFRDEDNPTTKPQTSFFPDRASPTENHPQTPNQRVLQQVEQTMSRLGVQQSRNSPPPPLYTPVDISTVNPFNALIGAVGAAAISYAAWTALIFAASFFTSHPMDAQIYVVQRLGAIVRTSLVCLLALASGISGVTSLGLFMLTLRTAYAKISAEFDNANQ
ncbi:unnamed protein product [Agarophyton chilense]